MAAPSSPKSRAQPGNSKNLRTKGEQEKEVGTAKKGGAGGKGTWGAPGISDLAESPVQQGDPNYDDEAEGCKASALSRKDSGKIVFSEYVPTLSAEEFKGKLAELLREYLASRDALEACRCLRELNSEDLYPEVIKRGVLLAFERDQKSREDMSRLLCALSTEGVLTSLQTLAGWGLLLRDDAYVADLLLDVPEAIRAMGQFLARSVVDECLYPSALDSIEQGPLHGAAVVGEARSLLKQQHPAARLASVWGTGGELQATKAAIEGTLREYFASGELDEAVRCAVEIDAGSYNHELVKKAITMTVDKEPADRAAALALMDSLSTEKEPPPDAVAPGDPPGSPFRPGPLLLGPRTFEIGFTRVLEAMVDLTLDCPSALDVFTNEFVPPAIEKGWIPVGFAALCVKPAAVKGEIKALIKEFLTNFDYDEAVRCFADLKVPHMGREAVRRAMEISMDGGQRDRLAVSRLFVAWQEGGAEVFPPGQIRLGFDDMKAKVEDLATDVPEATFFFGNFVERAMGDALLTDEEAAAYSPFTLA